VLRIPETEWQAIRRHAGEAYPHESCGVLVGKFDGEARVVASAVRCGNARTDSPHNRYQIDPREILRVARDARARGLDVVGFYHSHPDHPARPSPTDLDEAHWFGCSYVITSVARGRPDATRAFLLAGDEQAGKLFLDEEISIAPVEARAGRRA
jgi:proteasome lid subunit RPN8/RPN11